MLIWAGTFPQVAAAHGPVAPVASSYVARVGQAPHGLQAKVIDGDQGMWLRAPSRDTVVVLDYRGAPYLRFSPGGIEVNHNSALYYLNQTPVAQTAPAKLTRSTPASWHHVSGAHDYSWHDGRLHALATVALAPGVSYVGRWTIPLVLNGHLTALAGGVWHADDPSIVWLWPIAVVLLCVLAARRMRRPRLDATVARVVAIAALLASAAAGFGRQLHGRPTVSVFQLIELAIILAIVGWGLHRVLFRRPGYFAYFVIAFLAALEGIELLPTLLHGFVLLAIPAWLARTAAVLCLGCGASLLLLSLRIAEQPRRYAALSVLTLLIGCGSADRRSHTTALPRALVAQSRPIGRGPGFHPPASGPVIGACRAQLGPRIGAHVEVFAANRVVLVAAGIGTRPPLRYAAGRIAAASCYGDLVTLEPTGVVLMRPGTQLEIGDLFRSWGQPLSALRLASFKASPGTRVAAFVAGRRWPSSPAKVPLTRHAEIVLEVGPYVPPHSSYTFPPRT